MYSAVIDLLKQWNKTNDRHTKLQHLYLVAAAGVLVVAGVAGLLNYSLGQNLLLVSTLLALVFIVNAVAWAIADSFVISRLSKRSNKR